MALIRQKWKIQITNPLTAQIILHTFENVCILQHLRRRKNLTKKRNKVFDPGKLTLHYLNPILKEYVQLFGWILADFSYKLNPFMIYFTENSEVDHRPHHLTKNIWILGDVENGEKCYTTGIQTYLIIMHLVNFSWRQ